MTSTYVASSRVIVCRVNTLARPAGEGLKKGRTMKEMMKKVKERREGFTMAELLIVVAIVAVLVAIAIPVFNGQLHKSYDATDEANARSLYADLQADYLANSSGTYTAATWTGAPASGTAIAKDGTFKLSDGQTITLKSCTVTPTFTSGKGWTVTCVCSESGHVNATWGYQAPSTPSNP